MAWTVEHHDGEFIERLVFRARNGVEVVSHRFGDVDCTSSFRTDRNLVHVHERAGVEHRTAFGNCDDAQRVAAAERRECGAVDRVDGNVGYRFASVADVFTVEQHRRFVLFALTNHDDAIHVDGVQEIAHGIDRCAIGSILVTTSHPLGRRQCSGFGHPDQFHRQVAVGFVGERHRHQITPFVSH